MIVRLMGEGQYRIDDSVREQLNVLDDRAMAAIEAESEGTLAQQLNAMWELVRAKGVPLTDDDLSASDAIVPPFDLSLEEAGRLLSDDGFIPDLPVEQPENPRSEG